MLEKAVEAIGNGIIVDGFRIHAQEILKGRFVEEVNLDIYLARESVGKRLLYIKVFYGRKPHYSPWVEFFGINHRLILGEEEVRYFDSPFEDALLELFSRFLGPGGKMFVEYYADEETAKALALDIPPVLTRLGYKLFHFGFLWFKDWYFAEGYHEGGQKLQGVKPLHGELRRKQLASITHEVKAFLEREGKRNDNGDIMSKAIERAEVLIDTQYNTNHKIS